MLQAWFSEELPPSPSMSMLQASPSPLSSVSVCSGLLSNGQLSQRSPTPSLSESNCLGLYTSGQLSCVTHTFVHTYIHRGCEYFPLFQSWYPQSCSLSDPKSHPLIHDVIVIIIRITGISLSIHVQVFLSRVWQRGTIILQPMTTQFSEFTSHHNTVRKSDQTFPLFFYFLTVVGCVLLAG